MLHPSGSKLSGSQYRAVQRRQALRPVDRKYNILVEMQILLEMQVNDRDHWCVSGDMSCGSSPFIKIGKGLFVKLLDIRRGGCGN